MTAAAKMTVNQRNSYRFGHALPNGLDYDGRFDVPRPHVEAPATVFSERTKNWLEGIPASLLLEMNKQLTSAWADLATQAAEHPGRWFESVAGYQLDQMNLWWDVCLGRTPGPRSTPQGRADRRFAATEWQQYLVANYLKHSYLLTSSWLMKLADTTRLDGQDKQRLLFYLRQFIDAMSPSNFLATNPEVIKLAIETQGQSLFDGMQNLLADVKKGRISMTDESAFKLGENLAVTPGAVIYQNELIQLIQYQPTTSEVYKRPLLVVPPFINKFYILDLQPENSFVQYALDQGHAVFLISWRNPGPEQRHATWDDYLDNGVFRAIKTVKKIMGVKKINAVSWCVGGTLLATALAVLRARKKDRTITSATFFTTLLDFSEPGELGVFIDDTVINEREQRLQQTGLLPGKDLALVFSLLRANDLIWSYVVNNYLKGKTPSPFDILYWNSDPTNLPANLYISYVRNMYLENKLIEPAGLTMCGEPIDLRTITTPSFFLSTIDDHIAPWRATAKTIELFSGPVEFVLGASGHIAGVINPPAKNRRSYWIDGERGKSPDHWLDTAVSKSGSWWPHWSNWLKQFAGKPRPAPRQLGNDKYQIIEPAPGSYVQKRA